MNPRDYWGGDSRIDEDLLSLLYEDYHSAISSTKSSSGNSLSDFDGTCRSGLMHQALSKPSGSPSLTKLEAWSGPHAEQGECNIYKLAYEENFKKYNMYPPGQGVETLENPLEDPGNALIEKEKAKEKRPIVEKEKSKSDDKISLAEIAWTKARRDQAL
uniref:Uncharacterized protein n=1 Tax=Cannabis sativa TaxID=3483 RepID=A0A803QHG1_CANSA